MSDAWIETIAAFIGYLQAAGRSAGTIRLRRWQIQRLATAFPESPWTITSPELISYMGRDTWRPEYRKSMRGAIRTFYEWAVTVGWLVDSPAAKLPSVRCPAGRPRPTPDVVLHEALEKASQREALMLKLGAYAGLRISEIAKVHSSHVDGDRLRVIGKGGKQRDVPLHPVLLDELCSQPPGWIFPGKIDGHLSPGHVGVLLSRVLGPGWTAHKLRHRFATAAYAVERDLIAVQELLGHASLTSTAIYTLMPYDALSRAVLGAGPLIAA